MSSEGDSVLTAVNSLLRETKGEVLKATAKTSLEGDEWEDRREQDLTWKRDEIDRTTRSEVLLRYIKRVDFFSSQTRIKAKICLSETLEILKTLALGT